MKKKGFTLVELLAVLVILAIIALITIPIVVSTMNSSEEKSEMQSVKGYGRAIETDVSNWMMEDPSRNYRSYNFFDKNDQLKKYDYKGNEVACVDYNLDDKGKLTLSCCRIKDGSGKGYDYDNGKVKVSEDNNCNLSDVEEEQKEPTGVEYLFDEKANNANITTYNSGSDESHKMYVFNHSATEQTGELTESRYIGSDPYNYVKFNNEIWRILGVFTVENVDGIKEARIKIIKDNSIDNMSWDTNGYNDWSKSNLMNYLNDQYYNNLNDKAKKMVDDAKFYLGGNYTSNVGSAEDMYNWERGTNVIGGNNVSWIGKVGLMYPSDYAYTYAYGIEDSCYSNSQSCLSNNGGNPTMGWLFKSSYTQFTISPNLDESNSIFSVFSRGGIFTNNVSSGSSFIRPVMYLKANVKVSGGEGTKTDPYKLKIS